MPRCAFAHAICKTMPPLESISGNAQHLKACWVDVTNPNEQAYAERRRQVRAAAQQAALVELAAATTAGEERAGANSEHSRNQGEER
jgi:hypothetical protein